MQKQSAHGVSGRSRTVVEIERQAGRARGTSRGVSAGCSKLCELERHEFWLCSNLGTVEMWKTGGCLRDSTRRDASCWQPTVCSLRREEEMTRWYCKALSSCVCVCARMQLRGRQEQNSVRLLSCSIPSQGIVVPVAGRAFDAGQFMTQTRESHSDTMGQLLALLTARTHSEFWNKKSLRTELCPARDQARHRPRSCLPCIITNGTDQ